MKTVYIAAKFELIKEVREAQKKFSDIGYKVITDWTKHKPIKPYEENQKMSREYSIEDIKGAMDCDVLLLLSSEKGTGMYLELGAATASNLLRGKPEIYVVGKHNARSMFYFHPSINRRKALEDVINELKKNN